MTAAPVGRPLEAGIRDQLSANLGHDFGAVRVHTGPEADRSARSIGALAYTVGTDMVFSQGAYDPLSASGRSLLAHELAHVVQHGGRPHTPGRLLAPGHSVPPASARLERQADVAAAHHDRPLPPGWAWERASAPFAGLAPVNWDAPPAPYDVTFDTITRTITQEKTDGSEPGMLRVNIGSLILPAGKGPWVQRYNEIAAAGALQAVVDVSTSSAAAGLWQKRAPSNELRRLWLLRVGWPRTQASKWWNEAGGDPGSDDFKPSVGEPTQIDHVVELQLGGTNVPENLAPHDGPDNEESGRQIFRQVAAWANSVKAAVGPRVPGLRTVILHFSSAEQPVAYARKTQALDLLPAADPERASILAVRKGKDKGTASCALQVHFTALADAEAGTRPSADDRTAAAAARGPLSPYPVLAGPSTATLQVPAGNAAVPLETPDIPENRAARELISGMSLETLTRNTTPNQVTGWIDSPQHPARSGTRLPISVPAPADQRLAFDVGDAGRLSLKGGAKNIRFTYPYLSTGSLTLRETETGLEGTGTLRPSLPLLSRATINVTLAGGRLDGSIALDPSKLALPPFRITDASVNLSLAPQLAANGRIGFVLGSLLDGELIASVDAGGLLARGTVRAHIHGIDEATGQVEYRPATGLTGFVVVRASSPGGLIRSGQIRADFAGSGWSATGAVQLMLPGDNPVDLSVARRGDGLLYTGRARVNVPGLHPVDLEVSYDGEHVNGLAYTTFSVLGVNGDITLRYRDGAFSGNGQAELRRGKFTGTLDAHLDEQGRISGRGQGIVTLKPGLTGTVGVALAPDRQLHVTGELRFPPYTLFERRGGQRSLFRYTLPPIPIFAIPLPPPLGSVGIVATIGGGLDADYYIGAGQILDTVVTASFDPLADDSNLDMTANSRLVIPAHAGIGLSARLGVGLSAAVATATGGITVTGGLALDGGLNAGVTLHYRGRAFSIDAQAGIRVQPVLTLGIDADLMIDSPVYSNRWPYQLAAYRYDTGLVFGMNIPLHYASNEDFRFPSGNDIQWIIPDIDIGALAGRIGDRVRAGIGF
jgi:Domain of unknown function (DUF4157)